MDLSLGSAVTTLQPGQPLRLDGACGQRLSCVQGAVWITQDGDLRDTLLSAGAEFTFARNGVAVIQALGEQALIACEDGIARRPRARGLAALAEYWARLRGVWQLERSRRALASLSDRELQDIGVRRGQIDLLGI
jgi:uncharacterized protein YjiS (DUF1127 family)